MKVAIMQPYLFPYIGYFQLIAAVDRFVVYDNIKYTKKGWINRNRFLRDGADCTFTIPLRKDSDSLDVRDRAVAGDFDADKLVNSLREAYRRAPEFDRAFPVVERAIRSPERNLFRYILGSLREACAYLGIGTPLVTSSELPVDHGLKAQERVLAICGAVGATTYINPPGGTELYSREDFVARGIDLRFLRPHAVEYRQFDKPFVPWLSIVDVMMFNPPEVIAGWLREGYELA